MHVLQSYHTSFVRVVFLLIALFENMFMHSYWSLPVFFQKGIKKKRFTHSLRPYLRVACAHSLAEQLVHNGAEPAMALQGSNVQLEEIINLWACLQKAKVSVSVHFS